MRKKILKVFFVILTGITVTLTGCELSGSNESAQTESESGKDAVKFIPNLTTAVPGSQRPQLWQQIQETVCRINSLEITQKRKFTKAREIPQIRNLHRKKLMISNISLVIFCIPMKIR
jgi:hypothetical protein